MNRPHAPCPLIKAWYTGRIALYLSVLKPWAEDLNPPPPANVIHIMVFDKTLKGKNWMHKANQLLCRVHGNLWASRFRFPEDVVNDLLHKAS